MLCACDSHHFHETDQPLVAVLYTGLTREHSAGLRELIKSDGLEVLLGCLVSGIDRLVIKTLFLLCAYFSSEEAKC